MQEQMTGAAMAMPPDPNKAFKVSLSSAGPHRRFLCSHALCLSVPERVGGVGDRGTQVGAGECGGGAHVQRSQLWRLLQPGRQVHNVLIGSGTCRVSTRGNLSEAALRIIS